MPLLPTIARFTRGAVLLSTAITLSACGLFGEEELPPPCPEISVLRDAASLTQFIEGPGRDLIDVVVESEVVDASGACVYDVDDETGAGNLAVEMVVSIKLNRGPANRDREADIGYFVAITDVERNILNKETFKAKVPFTGNRNHLIWTDEPIYMDIPLKAKQTGRDFKIFLGLEVTRDQLQFNRRQLQELENRTPSGG